MPKRHYQHWILPFVWITCIIIVNPMGNFPLNDDWQYAYPVKQLLEKGQLGFLGIFAPNIILQVLWGYLFCLTFQVFDFSILRLSTLIIGGIGLYFFYRVARELGLTKWLSSFVTLCLMLNPLFFSLSFSFMTDVPFFSLCIGSIWFFIKFCASNNRFHFSGALLLALASFLIRQPGIVLLPTYGLFVLFSERFKWKGVKYFFALLLGALLFYWGFKELVKPWLGIAKNFTQVEQIYLDTIFKQPQHFIAEILKKIIKTIIYLGFFSLPFLPFIWPKLRASGFFKAKILLPILIFNGGLLIYLHTIDKIFPFGGNIMYNFGLGPELLADVYTLGLSNTPILPKWIMYLLNFISQISISFILLLLLQSLKQLSIFQKKVALLLIIANAIYLPLMSITAFFDRYLLLPIASFFVLLTFLNHKNPSYSLSKFLPFIGLSLFSLLATKDYLNWNRAKNQAFLYLQEQGISIKEMDAGVEYNGFYNFHKDRKIKEGISFWWVNDNRYMITFGPVEGYEEIAHFPFYRWLFLKRDDIKVLKRLE